jgi:hypothetical protein
MSVLFFDSSALVKRYLTETGSAWAISLLDPTAGHTIVVAAVTRVEAVQLAAALVVHDQYVAAGFPGLTLISADDDVNTAGQAEGLPTDNPNAHP